MRHKVTLAVISILLVFAATAMAARLVRNAPVSGGASLSVNVTTTANGGHLVTLTVTPGTGGGQTTGYVFLRSTTSGGPYTQLTPGTSSTVTYPDGQNLVEGTTYYYVAQATGPGGTSGNSPQATATIPFLPPPTPSGLSTAVQ